MLMSGRRVEADEALRIGLVNRLLTAETLVAETLDYARTLADRIAPLSIRSLKRQMRDGPGRTFEAAFASAAIDAAEARASQDMREGLAAAREKRPARFTGE
jgi:enoyl-CoA hydratase/carnithine racemase